MPLYKNTPQPSGRMGLLWALAPIYDATILEYGSMGHMIYAEKWMAHTGLRTYARLATTHLAEKDIALGLTKRLEDSVRDIVKKGDAKSIFLIPSSVPEMIGTDLEAIGEELQFAYPKVPIITFGAGNFKATMTQGMEEAYYKLVTSLPDQLTGDESLDESKKACLSYNLIGSGCDWSRFQEDAREIKRIMAGAFDMKPAAVFGSCCNTASIANMTKANITLVIRQDGLKAAKELKKRYGIPYLYVAPYGLNGTKNWIMQMEQIVGITAKESFIKKEMEETSYAINQCKVWAMYQKEKAKIWISKEDELSKGIQEFACNELGFTVSKGEIHMGDAIELRKDPAKCNIEIRRSTLSYAIHTYELPFVGFRGAMNLCALWYKHFTS